MSDMIEQLQSLLNDAGLAPYIHKPGCDNKGAECSFGCGAAAMKRVEDDALDLLSKLADGTGGTRTGLLKQLGYLEWRVTEKGLAALGRDTKPARSAPFVPYMLERAQKDCAKGKHWLGVNPDLTPVTRCAWDFCNYGKGQDT